MAETKSSLAIVAEKLDAPVQKTLLESYQEAYDLANTIVAEYKGIAVTDVTQTSEMARAREGRLKLRQLGADVEKRRKALKERSLREGQAIDGMANVIKNVIEPVKEYLELQEKFADIQKEKLLDEQLIERQNALRPYGVDPTPELRTMDALEFNVLLAGAKVRYEAKVAEDKKAENERQARLEADLKERERLAKERVQLEEKLAAERKAREAAEAKVEAARKVEEAKAEAERKAALAPDRDKLLAYVDALNGVPLPTVDSPEALELRQRIEKSLRDISEKIKKAVEDL